MAMKTTPPPTRAQVLHCVIDEMLRRQDGTIPADVENMSTFFDSQDDLINAVLLRWHTRLVSSIERGLVDDPEDREEAVIEAWQHAARLYRGVLAAIDDLTADPTSAAVARAVHTTLRNDQAAMAVAAGLASGPDDLAVRVGQRLELEARRRLVTAGNAQPHESPLLHRVIAKLTSRPSLPDPCERPD